MGWPAFGQRDLFHVDGLSARAQGNADVLETVTPCGHCQTLDL